MSYIQCNISCVVARYFDIHKCTVFLLGCIHIHLTDGHTNGCLLLLLARGRQNNSILGHLQSTRVHQCIYLVWRRPFMAYGLARIVGVLFFECFHESLCHLYRTEKRNCFWYQTPEIICEMIYTQFVHEQTSIEFRDNNLLTDVRMKLSNILNIYATFPSLCGTLHNITQLLHNSDIYGMCL